MSKYIPTSKIVKLNFYAGVFPNNYPGHTFGVAIPFFRRKRSQSQPDIPLFDLYLTIHRTEFWFGMNILFKNSSRGSSDK